VRGGYYIEDVRRQQGGYEKVPKGIMVDCLGRLQYEKTIDMGWRFMDRTYQVRSDGRAKLFSCDQFDYDSDTKAALKAKARAARYMNKLMEFFSQKVELATKKQVERRQLEPYGYYGSMALCEICQEWGHDSCKTCGKMLCSKHLENHSCNKLRDGRPVCTWGARHKFRRKNFSPLPKCRHCGAPASKRIRAEITEQKKHGEYSL
jgi:hypothetical protein